LQGKNFREVFSSLGNPAYILLILVTVLVVHGIKSCRLFLALYGRDLRFREFLKIYCKVTPVSVVLPFKLGDIFRMYCYGHALGNYLRGIVVILLDRFMDTAALATIILFFSAIFDGGIGIIFYLLMLFLLFILLAYYLFPNIYRFWNHYFLVVAATPRRLWTLNVLSKANAVYQDIHSVVEGRWAMLYFMSLMAWTVELGSLFVVCRNFNLQPIRTAFNAYLSSAITGVHCIELEIFIVVSIIILAAGYGGIKFLHLIGRQVKA